jgi:hypothetical protein
VTTIPANVSARVLAKEGKTRAERIFFRLFTFQRGVINGLLIEPAKVNVINFFFDRVNFIVIT